MATMATFDREVSVYGPRRKRKRVRTWPVSNSLTECQNMSSSTSLVSLRSHRRFIHSPDAIDIKHIAVEPVGICIGRVFAGQRLNY